MHESRTTNRPVSFLAVGSLCSKSGVYTGVHYFSCFAKNIDCGYSLEPPRRGGSNEYPQSMF